MALELYPRRSCLFVCLLSARKPTGERVQRLVTFTTGLKKLGGFKGDPFQLRLSIPRINSCMKWSGCGRRVHVDKGPVPACPRTNIKRSCIVFAVTSIALILWPLRTKMLERSAQSLIGSPGTLPGEHYKSSGPRSFGFFDAWMHGFHLPSGDRCSHFKQRGKQRQIVRT